MAIRTLFRYMGNRRWLLPVSMVLSALSALGGLLPFVLIWLIVKSLLAAGGEQVPPDVLGYAWGAALWAMGSVVLYFLALMASHLAAFRVESNLRREAMRRVMEMPLGFFDTYPSGRIRKVIDDNASITHSFLAHQLPDLAGTVLVPLALVVLIGWFNWQLGLACILPFVFAMALMGYMMNTSGRNFMQQYMSKLEEMNTEAVEYVRGIPVVKVFQQTIYSFKNFHRSIVEYNRMALGYTRLWEKPMSAYTVVVNGFVFFLTPVAILLVAHGGDLAEVLVDYFLFVLVTPVFSCNIMRSMYLGQALGEASEAIGRMEKMLALPAATASEFPVVKDWVCREASIEFRHVSFTYPGAVQRAVDDVSFSVSAGQTVALVGASGGGKTTLARLVPRFWTADEGQVLLGGTDVRRIPQDRLMDSVSFVFQNTRLFKDTLRANICYGRPDATLADVKAAIDQAQCRDIIDRLPHGLDTRIGSEGTYLSGGEQQRILLVRAVLKNAPVLVLDEATAFADPESEHLIRQALGRLMKGKTVLMIAHRLTTVTGADCILVIDRGRIVEQGTHDELLALGGRYRRMWDEYQRSVSWTLSSGQGCQQPRRQPTL